MNNHRPAILGETPLLEQEAGIVRPSIADYTTPALLQGIEGILKSNLVTNGAHGKQLEEAMARYLGVAQVASVSSCTLGQTLALQAAGIVGKEIIVPSFTIAATANAAYWNGCKIKFADIDLDTYNISLEHVAELISEETAAIMPVHVFGNPCPVDALQGLADRRGVKMVYDSAQAFGSSYQGVKMGGFGEFEVFSGSPTKHFTSLEGGYVATNNAELARMIRLTRNYGVLPNYDCVLPGLNARLPEINALVGKTLLPETDQFVARRNRYATTYKELLGGLPGLRFQQITPGGRSSYNYFGMMVEPAEFGLTNRQLAEALKAERIGTKVYYHPPVHQQQAYQYLNPPHLPNTEYLAERIICLPMYNTMSDTLLEQIAEALRRVHHHAPAVRRKLTGELAHV